MKTVWKFPLDLNRLSYVRMPTGYEILKIDCQDDQPMIWALVDPEAPMDTHGFLIRGTGHPVPDGMGHIASFFQGPFVWHVFQRKD